MITYIFLAIFFVAAILMVGAVWKINSMVEKVRKEDAAERTPSHPVGHNEWPESVDNGQPVYMADDTTMIPGCRAIGGMFVVSKGMEVGDRNSYHSKRDAIKKSKELYPGEWHRILAPKPEEVAKARTDLQAIEDELEQP